MISCDLHSLLIDEGAILVHFSAPPGGREPGRIYPFDLRYAIASKPDLCCSTIHATDSEQNSYGLVGIILRPVSVASLKGVAPNDDGSIERDGVIEYRDPDVTLRKCRAAIEDRGSNGMNEWGVAAKTYDVLGVFTFGHLLFWSHETPARLARLRADLPGQRIFSQWMDGFAEIRTENTPEPVTVQEIYGC
jgi:hypothetical protein